MRDQPPKIGRPAVNYYGGPLSKGMVNVVLAMCDNCLVMAAAGRDLGVTTWTIDRQLDLVELRTGLNCREFFDAVELYNMVWDEYPDLIEDISKDRFVGKRVPMKYIP